MPLHDGHIQSRKEQNWIGSRQSWGTTATWNSQKIHEKINSDKVRTQEQTEKWISKIYALKYNLDLK